MPRLPNPKSPLARLRMMAGLSAKQVSERVGVSLNTWRCMEREKHRLAVTPAVAEKIAVATGASAKALLGGKLRNASGHPYTAEDYQIHQLIVNRPGPEGLEAMQTWLAVLSTAAGDKQRAVLADVGAALDAVARKHGVMPTIKRIMQDAGEDETVTYSIRTWLSSPMMQACYKPRLPKWARSRGASGWARQDQLDEKVPGHATWFTAWNPASGNTLKPKVRQLIAESLKRERDGQSERFAVDYRRAAAKVRRAF